MTFFTPERFLVQHYQQIDPHKGDLVPTADIYRSYLEWCEVSGHRVVGERAFGKAIVKVFPEAKRQRPGPRRQRYWAYGGIERKDNG